MTADPHMWPEPTAAALIAGLRALATSDNKAHDAETLAPRFRLRYRPGTDLARRFGTLPSLTSWPTAEAADRLRLGCPNASSIEVVREEP